MLGSIPDEHQIIARNLKDVVRNKERRVEYLRFLLIEREFPLLENTILKFINLPDASVEEKATACSYYLIVKSISGTLADEDFSRAEFLDVESTVYFPLDWLRDKYSVSYNINRPIEPSVKGQFGLPIHSCNYRSDIEFGMLSCIRDPEI